MKLGMKSMFNWWECDAPNDIFDFTQVCEFVFRGLVCTNIKYIIYEKELKGKIIIHLS